MLYIKFQICHKLFPSVKGVSVFKRYFVLGVTCLCVTVCIKLNLHYCIFNSFIRNQLLLHPGNKEELYFI